MNSMRLHDTQLKDCFNALSIRCPRSRRRCFVPRGMEGIAWFPAAALAAAASPSQLNGSQHFIPSILFMIIC